MKDAMSARRRVTLHAKFICLLLFLFCSAYQTFSQSEVLSEYIKVTAPYPTAIEGEVITLRYELVKPAADARIHVVPFNAVKTDSSASTFTFKVKNTLGVDYATFFFLLIKPGGEIVNQAQLNLPITSDHLTALILYASGNPIVNKEFPALRGGQIKFEVGTDKKQCTTVRINEMEVSVSVRGKAESRTYYSSAFSLNDFSSQAEGALLTVRVIKATCERQDHSTSSFSLPAERMIVRAKVTSNAKRVPSAR